AAKRTAVVAAALILPAAGSLGAAALLWADVPGEIYPPLRPLRAVGSLSAKRCGQCHPDQLQEWARSHHAQAVSDPLYRADFDAQRRPFFCDQCHAPLVEQLPRRTLALLALWPRLLPLQRENPRFDPALHDEGVTCVACHQVDEQIAGPRGDPTEHPTFKSTALLTEQVCARCHTLAMQHLGSLQRPLMETVAEWREYRAKGGDKVCQDCHLPRVPDRPAAPGADPKPARSHALLGPFDGALLDAALEVVDARLEKGPGPWARARVRVRNLTGHRLPTAEPHRAVEVMLEALGSGGVPVSVSTARLERLVDLGALRELPGQDTTLRPGETREVPLSPVHTGSARSARVSIRFVRWPAQGETARAAGLSAQELVHPLFTREFPLTPQEAAP
ncbi:MAG TPA: hypothetical protein VND93_04020, partial [Myxococcales bacterium]|nr:hypothetical protein [Myxococcales bacterium]